MTTITVEEPVKTAETTLQNAPNHSDAPVHRKRTNYPSLVGFALCCLLMIPMSFLFTMNSDIRRIFYGYDKFGNICGVKNRRIFDIPCSGQNMTERPIAMMRYVSVDPSCPFSKKKILPDECVESCDPPNDLILNRCYPSDVVNLENRSKYFKQATEFLHIIQTSSFTIIAMTSTALVLSFGLFVFLRCHTAATFWGLILFQSFISLTSGTYFWHNYIVSENNSAVNLLLAMISLGYFAFILLFFFVLHNTFILICQIYEDALNAVWRIPLIFIQPILILSILIPVITGIVFIMLLSLSNECLKMSKEDPFTYVYVVKVSSVFYSTYLTIMSLWMYSLGEGWLTMIVSGATKEYYKTRDKMFLRNPLRKSFYTLVNFHLGTIAIGSLLVTLLSFVRGLTEFITRRIYVITVINGQSYNKSFSHSLKLLRLNFIDTIAITGFNYLVVFGYTFLIILISIGVGIWINLDTKFSTYIQLGIFIGAFCAVCVSRLVFQILHTTTETVFLCICEGRLRTENNASSIQSTTAPKN